MTGELLNLNPNTSIRSKYPGQDMDREGIDSEQRDFRALARVLWRRKLSILAATLVFGCIGMVVIWLIPPRYVAKAVVVISDHVGTEPSIDPTVHAGAPNTQPDIVGIQTQADLIRTPTQIGAVVDALKLQEDSEFNPDLLKKEEGTSELSVLRSVFLDRLDQVMRAAERMLSAPPGGSGQTPEQAADQSRARTVEAVLARLHVTPNPNSRIVAVDFESENAASAAAVANGIVDEYIARQRAIRANRLAEVDRWMTEKIVFFRDQVENSEKSVEKFRAENDLISNGAGMSLLQKQMAETDSQLSQAISTRTSDEARLARLRDLLSTPGGIDATNEALYSPTLQSLQQQLATLERTWAEQRTKLLPRYPTMISAQAEIDNVRQRIRNETSKMLQSLDTETKVAIAKEAELRDREEVLKPQIAAANQADITLRALERDVHVNTTMLDAFMTRIKQGEDAKLPPSQTAQLVSHAEVPTRPAKPNKVLLAGLALGGALMAAVALAFTLERWDHTFRSGEQIELDLDLRFLGLLPLSKRLRGLVELSGSEPLSIEKEAMRTIYANLRVLGFAAGEPRSLLISSAQPGEGKTTLSLCLAVLAAQSGRKAIVVDADLRRREASKAAGIDRLAGLAEILARGMPLEDGIIVGASGVDYMPAGQPNAVVDAIASIDNVRLVVQALKQRYDVVIVDSPPVLAVTDALTIAQCVDWTVMSVRWGATPRKIVKLALRRLASSGTKVAGATLAMVNSRRHAQYGYSDSMLYSKSFRDYQTAMTKKGRRVAT